MYMHIHPFRETRKDFEEQIVHIAAELRYMGGINKEDVAALKDGESIRRDVLDASRDQFGAIT